MKLMITTSQPLTADIIADGVEKRIPTVDEIAGWNNGNGGGGLPDDATLDDLPDGETRVALSPADVVRLAAYVENDGKTGDMHAISSNNPHGTTAADVGAATAEALAVVATSLATAEGEIGSLDGRVDALETTATAHTNELSSLDTRLDNLEGTGKQWVHGPFMVRNAQPLSYMPAAVTPWTNGMARKVSLWKSSRLFFWAHVGTADTNTGAALRFQYTTDLVNDTGWADLTGADIPLTTTAMAGRAGAIIDTPAGCKTQEFVLIRCCGVSGGGNQSPTISFPTIAMELDAIAAPGGGGSGVASFNGRINAVTPQADDYSYDMIAETTTGKKFTATLKTKLDGIAAGAQVNTVASVHGRGDAVVAQSGDYTTDLVTEVTNKKYVTDADLAKLANVPANTASDIAAKASTTDLTNGLSSKADAAATATALAAKAPLASPALTGNPTGPTPATGDSSQSLATTEFVKNQGYITSVPTHGHAIADVGGAGPDGLAAKLASLQTQIDQLTHGDETAVRLQVLSTAPVNIPATADVVFVEHLTSAANLVIADGTARKAHTLVFLGNPNTVNIKASGSQTLRGNPAAGYTYTSGTDGAPVSRTIFPDPDPAFPSRWRII